MMLYLVKRMLRWRSEGIESPSSSLMGSSSKGGRRHIIHVGSENRHADFTLLHPPSTASTGH